jgi:hypothetical protein
VNAEARSYSSELQEFEELGFTVLHLSNVHDVISALNMEIEELIRNLDFRTNSKIYSYNDAPRIVEAWKNSANCLSLALNREVLAFLRLAYESEPRAFSTINFVRSTQQPLHSDYVHFGTLPHLRLAACWIALEDIHPDSGPLQVVPGSHKDEIFCYDDLGLPIPTSIGEVKVQYGLYEDWVRDRLKQTSTEAVVPKLAKGDALIWSANLLHGSPDCIDNQLSRMSQVTHYHFEDVRKFYNPSFSRLRKGMFRDRSVAFIEDPNS